MINWVNSLGSVINIITFTRLKRKISIFNDIIVFIKLISILKKNKIDIIHCHSSKAGLIGRFAAFFAGVGRIIFTVHGWSGYSAKNKIIKLIYDLLERSASLVSSDIICVSDADKEYALKNITSCSRKLHVIKNGVQLEVCKPHLREELGLNEADFIIGTVARLSRQKNPLFTIELYKKILEDNPAVYFVWIGSGPLSDKCLDYVKLMGIERKFIFLGDRTDVAYLLPDFNLFSLLSDWESFPLSILEAMASGLPIIASDVGGVSEMVQDETNGILIRRKNIDDNRQIIQALISDPFVLESYGRKSRQIIEYNFSEKKMIGKYREIYNG